MGQYFKIVNLDKRQCLSPWTFGNGAKLLEFSNDGTGMMVAFAILTASDSGFIGNSPLIGSWAGDRIVIAGDNATTSEDGSESSTPPYFRCSNDYIEPDYIEDISEQMLLVMMRDGFMKWSLPRWVSRYTREEFEHPELKKMFPVEQDNLKLLDEEQAMQPDEELLEVCLDYLEGMGIVTPAALMQLARYAIDSGRGGRER